MQNDVLPDETTSLAGSLCETCLDAVGVDVVSAPWGGEMYICQRCLWDYAASTGSPSVDGNVRYECDWTAEDGAVLQRLWINGRECPLGSVPSGVEHSQDGEHFVLYVEGAPMYRYVRHVGKIFDASPGTQAYVFVENCPLGTSGG